MASRRPAGPTSHGALSTASRAIPGGAGRGALACGHRGRRATRRPSGEAGRDWFGIADRDALLWVVSRFCLRRRAPAGRAAELPRPDMALVEPSLAASASLGRAAEADGRGGRVGSGHARGAAFWRTGLRGSDFPPRHLGLDRKSVV